MEAYIDEGLSEEALETGKVRELVADALATELVDDGGVEHFREPVNVNKVLRASEIEETKGGVDRVPSPVDVLKGFSCDREGRGGVREGNVERPRFLHLIEGCFGVFWACRQFVCFMGMV